jgi:hypothetical protein
LGRGKESIDLVFGDSEVKMMNEALKEENEKLKHDASFYHLTSVNLWDKNIHLELENEKLKKENEELKRKTEDPRMEQKLSNLLLCLRENYLDKREGYYRFTVTFKIDSGNLYILDNHWSDLEIPS